MYLYYYFLIVNIAYIIYLSFKTNLLINYYIEQEKLNSQSLKILKEIEFNILYNQKIMDFINTLNTTDQNELLTQNIAACNSIAELKNVLNNIPSGIMQYSSWTLEIPSIIKNLDAYVKMKKRNQNNSNAKKPEEYLRHFTRKFWLRSKIKELVEWSNQLWDISMMQMQHKIKIDISAIIEAWNKYHLNIKICPEVLQVLKSLFIEYPDLEIETQELDFMWEKLLIIEANNYRNICQKIVINTANWKIFNINFPSSYSGSIVWDIEHRFTKRAIMLYNNWDYYSPKYEWSYHLPHMLVDIEEWKPLIIQWTNYAITHINDGWSLVEFNWENFYLVSCSSDDGYHTMAYVNKDFIPLMHNNKFFFNERNFTLWVNSNIYYCSSNLKYSNCHL